MRNSVENLHRLPSDFDIDIENSKTRSSKEYPHGNCTRLRCKRSVIIADGDAMYCRDLGNRFRKEGWQVQEVSSWASLLEEVAREPLDRLVVISLGFSTLPLSEVLGVMWENSRSLRVVGLTDGKNFELAVRAMEQGVCFVIDKSRSVEEAYAEVRKRLQIDPPQSFELGQGDAAPLLIGKSSSMSELKADLARVMQVDCTVLIVGESGTGKEIVAKSIHNGSLRSSQHMHAVNCGAIPEGLLESELFGHKRGSFTDAKSDRKGLFEICSNGSLLLDEISEMPIQLQVKLLRVLQEREIRPVGSNQTIKTDVRIIAATNKHPLDAVREGRFREDLYYRLSVITIFVPPLRERKTDIPDLVDYFLDEYTSAFNKQICRPSHELYAKLCSYDWPGNVRELENAVERGVALAPGEHLRAEDMLNARRDGLDLIIDSYNVLFEKPLSEARSSFEQKYLEHVLTATNGNVAEAARVSSRHRADFYRLLTKHRIRWQDFRS